jgi:hypothetical protein
MQMSSYDNYPEQDGIDGASVTLVARGRERVRSLLLSVNEQLRCR